MDTSDDAVPEELYLQIAQYREDAFRLARRLTRNTAEAEDIAQTALLNVLRRAEYIEDETKVRSYLLTAVRNVWRNHLRSRGGRRFLGTDVAEMVPSTDVEPDEQVLNALEVSLAGAAMNTLSPKSHEVLTLRYVDRLDFHELAARLGITPVAARQRAHRAREELVGACMELSARNGEGICRQIRGRLGRYHRGLLGRVVRAEVEFHLAECPACSSCYAQLIDLYGHRLGRSPKDEA